MGTWILTVIGEQTVTRFARTYPTARKPFARFLEIAKEADWPHFPAVKESFPAADYASETKTIIFDIGGNKFRLTAAIDFEKQILNIEHVMTHAEYERKKW